MNSIGNLVLFLIRRADDMGSVWKLTEFVVSFVQSFFGFDDR